MRPALRIRFAKGVGLLFFFFHVAAVTYGNLPRAPLYPSIESLASGLGVVRGAEQGGLWAARFLRQELAPVDRVLGAYTRLTGNEQSWNTFAPVPPVFVSQIQVVAVDGKGRTHLLWRGPGAEVAGRATRLDPLLKLLETLPQPGRGDLQFLFARYHARQYLREHGVPPAEVLLVEWIRDIPPPEEGSLGEVRPVERVFFRAPGERTPEP